jgi:DNA (cytosine-5)-methyltransferase 1
MTPTALDLFCGAGGLSLGLKAAGYRVLGAFDAWGPAVRSYQANFEEPCFLEDIATLDAARLAELGIPPEVDVVAGGPPCQGFSIQRIGPDEDGRNDLVMAFGRVVLAARAKAFILENVRGLVGARGRKTLARFKDFMSANDYDIDWRVIDAVHYGVPQSRKRVFVVGKRRDSQGRIFFPAPQGTPPMTVAEALAGLPSPPADFAPSPSDPLHRRTRLSALNQQRIELVPPGGGFEDLPPDLRVECHKAGASRIGHRSVYGRLHPNRPAATITARFDSFTRGRFGHPTEPRNLTLREGARLQGFPDTHVFLGTQEEVAAQIGNAVPPPLARAVAEAIVWSLRGEAISTGVAQLPLFAAAE